MVGRRGWRGRRVLGCGRVWRVAFDELLADGDLDPPVHDRDLDLAALVAAADPVVAPAKQRLPLVSTLRVTDTADADGRSVSACVFVRGPSRLLFAYGHGVARGCDQHAVVVDVHEPAIAHDLDGLAGQRDTT